MKVRDKKTGQIFEIAKGTTFHCYDKEGHYMPIKVEDLALVIDDDSSIEGTNRADANPIKDIDWEARRFELIKAALQGILSNECIEISLNDECSEYYSLAKDIGNAAVTYADAVIEKLKAELYAKTE